MTALGRAWLALLALPLLSQSCAAIYTVQWEPDLRSAYQGMFGVGPAGGTIAWGSGEPEMSFVPGRPHEGSWHWSFLAAPLPESLYLNASRPLQMIIAYNSSRPANSPGLVDFGQARLSPFQVWVNTTGRTIAWADGSEQRLAPSVVWGPGSPEPWPQNPPGYIHRYLSLALETDVLAEGTVLEVTIVSQKDVQLAVGRPHGSIMALPWLNAEEAIFRFWTAEDEVDSIRLGQAVGIVVAAWLSGSTRRRILVGTCGLAFLLAGCLGGAGAPEVAQNATGILPHGGVEPGNPEDDRFNVTTPTTGTLLGRVHDDVGVPIGRAHVALVHTSSFTETGKDGRFQIRGLASGEHTLRVDRTGYHSVEGKVRLEGGKVTRVTVMLVQMNPPPRDFRPHLHDEWTDKATLGPILDATWRLMPTTSSNNPHDENGMWRFETDIKPGRINAVIPGTSEVQVVIQWPEGALSSVQLFVQSNKDLPRQGIQNWSAFAPRGSGVPFRIATTWGMTDPGHQPYSTWAWAVRWNGLGACQRLEYVAGGKCVDEPIEVRARVYLQRGNQLPLEGGHPDRWRGKDHVPLVSNERLTNFSCGGGSLTQPGDWGLVGSGRWQHKLSLENRAFVPYGTQWVNVTLRLGRASSFGDYDFDLHYRPADSNEFLHARSRTVSSRTVQSWIIPVEPMQADWVYAKKQRWILAWSVTEESQDAFGKDACTNGPIPPGTVQPRQELYFSAAAHRTPVPR